MTVRSSTSLPGAVQYAVPTAGQTVTAGSAAPMLVLNPAGTLATLTVTLPASPYDGQRVTIASSQSITLLTLNGGTIVGPPTTLALGGFASFVFSAAAAAWYRIG